MSTSFRSLTLVPILALAVVAAACIAPSGIGPSGSAASGTSPVASLPFIDSTAAAAKLVAATSPLFDGIGPKDANLIGQADWYEAHPTEAAKPPVTWQVTFSVGWGDCPAGCISRHTWVYSIGVDASVALVSETGPALPSDVITRLGGASSFTGLGGRASAGPTCPVMRQGDVNCLDRPVAGAVLIVTDAGGGEVARATTDASGQFRIALKPGDYVLEPQPVKGLMGTAAPMPFTVTESAQAFLTVAYDTGIR